MHAGQGRGNDVDADAVFPQTAPADRGQPFWTQDAHDRGLYERPPGLPHSSSFNSFSSGTREHVYPAATSVSLESANAVRQIIADALRENMVADSQSPGKTPKSIRAIASLPSPHSSRLQADESPAASKRHPTESHDREAQVNHYPGVMSASTHEHALLEESKVEKQDGEQKQNTESQAVTTEKTRQSTVQRASQPEEQAPDIVETQGIPRTLQECTEISCNWFFGGFKRASPLRRLCFNTIHSILFSTISMLITVANSMYIALAPGLKNNDGEVDEGLKNLEDALLWFDIACAGFLGFEILLGIIAYGFYRSPSTYLRNSGFHQLDFACFWVAMLEYLAIYLGLPNFTLRPFRMLRFFRLICKIEMFSGIKNIIATLKEGLPQLMIIFLFLLLTLAAWIILCMAVYQKSMRRRCVTRAASIPVCSSDFSTDFNQSCNLTSDVDKTLLVDAGSPAISGGYPFETWCKIRGVEWDWDGEDWVRPTPFNGTYDHLLVTRGYFDKGENLSAAARGLGGPYPKDDLGRYHTCQANSWKAVDNFITTQRCEEVGNPMAGFSHFDNMWGGAASLFQVIAPDSYYDVWGRLQEAEPVIYPLTLIIFVCINVIDTFLLLGLFVAVVTGTFKRIRDMHEKSKLEQQPEGTHGGFLSEEQEQDVLENAVQSEDTVPANSQNNMAKEEDDLSAEEVMQRASVAMIKSTAFQSFISLTILLQLASISGITPSSSAGGDGGLDEFARIWKDFSYYSQVTCSFIFLIELILNYCALMDMTIFWQRPLNRIEAMLTLLSLIGIAANIPELAVLPAFRGYRLMKYFATLQDLLKSAGASVLAIINVAVFIGLVGLCFVVAGRYMIGSKMNPFNRSNFGDMVMASLTMFQLFTGDSWSAVMYSAMMPFDDPLSQFFGAFLVITWFIFASIIAQNLFVAVIIENFQITDTIANLSKPGNIASLRQTFREAYTAVYRRNLAITSGAARLDVNSGQLFQGKTSARILYENFALVEKEIRKRLQQSEGTGNSQDSRILRAVAAATVNHAEGLAVAAAVDDHAEPERVLYFLLPKNPVRRFFVNLGQSQTFDNIILACILVSCLFLIIEPPYRDLVEVPGQTDVVKPELLSYSSLDNGNYVFTFVFLVEFVCRVMGQGLYYTKKAYLKDGWNIMDTVVLTFALIEYSKVLEGMGIVKIIRMGRALKPLRLMKRNQSMRLVIDALLTTLLPLTYVILFLLFTLIVFGLVAIGMFGGKLFSCSNPSVAFPEGKLECSGTWISQSGNLNGVMFPSVWANPYHFNFDDPIASFTSLFMVSTFKYVSIIFACMDITEINKSPVPNHSTQWSIFFIVYICIGGLFVMNLFVAFIIDGFNVARGSTQQEEVYRRFRRQLWNSRPQYDTFKPPRNALSTQLRKFIESNLFQGFSTLCVLVNVGMLLADNADADGDYERMMVLQDDIFYAELCVEVFLCLIAYGPLGFYNNIWRFFDLFVCVGQFVGYMANNPSISAFVKVFRLARVIRLAARIKAIRAILQTLISVAPQLSNVVLLLFLVYSMFAVAGFSLFETTRFGVRLGPTGKFRGYLSSILLIWQIITGDEWMILMKDCAVRPPYCTQQFTIEFEPTYQGPARSWGDCGIGGYSLAYFLVLKLVCEYMMLNLFIGLILDNFSYITEDVGHEEDPMWTDGPSENQLIAVRDVFQRYDLGTGFVPTSSIPALLNEIPVPLGYREADGRLCRKDEYATELLIRAEVNLCMRRQRAQNIEKDRKRWFKKPEIKQVYVNGIDFDTLIAIIVYWRLPSLVPGLVQWQRHEEIEEAVLMAHALQILDFFRSLVAKRKRQKILNMVSKRRSFINFCDTDSHRKRRNILMADMKRTQAEQARSRGLPLLDLLPRPAQPIQELVLTWLPMSELPEDIITHSMACQQHQLLRVPQPITGIEVFKQRIAQHEVVLRVVDPISHNAYKDLLIGDLSKLQWNQWHALNTKFESYFHPATFAGFDEYDRQVSHEEWDRIDVLTENRKSEMSKKMKGVISRRKRLGSIAEIQSFVLEEAPSSTTTGPQKKRYERANSVLRLNLGNHLYCSEKVVLQASNFQKRKFGSGINKLQNVKGFQGLRHLAGRRNAVAPDLQHDAHHLVPGTVDLSEGDTVLVCLAKLPSSSDIYLPTVFTPVLHAFLMLKIYAN